MLFKFTGRYTNGHETITVFGTTFQGHEPADVSSEDGIRRLSGHPEFEAVTAEAEKPLAEPKAKRGRKPKA